MQIKKQLLKIMRKSTYSPSVAEDITKKLGPGKGISLKAVKKTLNELLAEGRIAKDKEGRFILAKGPEVIGTFEAKRQGFGFIITTDFDVYVRSNNVGNAMHGDTVRAVITKKRRHLSFEGKIMAVLERAADKVIGRLETRDSRQFLFPSDRRINYIFELIKPIEEPPGMILEAAITEYPVKGVGKCEVIEIIGGEDEPGVEVQMIIREHGLRVDFPSKVLEEASKAPKAVSSEEIKGRIDYRDDYVVTIDGLDAKDFDDAVQITYKDGLYNLKVHIADVSHYVSPGSDLDKEASRRSFSTYLADRVLPMLPEELSNGICSLNPDVDRLTMSAEIAIDKKGTVQFFSVNEGVIRSKARLTYNEVDEALATGSFADKEQKQTLLLMAELSDILEEKRTLQGSVNFETIEPKVVVDDELNPIQIEVREKTPATKLIEEAMVLTNEVVANWVFNKKLPLIYRIHEDPAEDALEEVRQLLGQMGYPAKKIGKATAEAFQSIIKFAHQRKDRLIINSILLRLMKKARYSTLEVGHFGLALKHYAHFTSPIRRYPDFLVHRQVKSLLFKEPPLTKELLTETAKGATLREEESAEAERESNTVYICQLMKNQMGEVFEGVISGVTNFGLFVQLPNSAEGLIHISNLRGDYYRYEAERFVLRGVRTGQVFRLGQALKVKLINVVIGERQIDLVPI